MRFRLTGRAADNRRLWLEIFLILLRKYVPASLAACGSVIGVALLVLDLLPNFAQTSMHTRISAASLLLAGCGWLTLQAVRRPNAAALVKGVMLGLAFVFWGIDQLLRPGMVATILGDLVIVLFIVDLTWMMMGELRG